ncbi:hypothetical protein [Silvibacterium acidisoli]|uniref:hypothetical protein n=1 Tax=Acidobacteriaceae bacterium ZG23-2 TaxID=2883246 RepID=UPI00406D43F8
MRINQAPGYTAADVIRNRHNSVLRTLAVIAMLIMLASLLVPHLHADHLTPCLAAVTMLLIETLPLMQRIQGWSDPDHGSLPDSPTPHASFQRPPPFLAV